MIQNNLFCQRILSILPTLCLQNVCFCLCVPTVYLCFCVCLCKCVSDGESASMHFPLLCFSGTMPMSVQTFVSGQAQAYIFLFRWEQWVWVTGCLKSNVSEGNYWTTAIKTAMGHLPRRCWWICCITTLNSMFIQMVNWQTCFMTLLYCCCFVFLSSWKITLDTEWKIVLML